ncbi:hypothetical protein I4F81_006438 [Pyropia yezoensis]|uniref:Uncharacterized protein n=1 Tax=Pyropia yezoensis TaxID=2788 RepID=A0ACC3C1M4_PYRYE|nr:hypothetical protein I4F81_006438 [Neopyropia yezoensis]
MLLRVVARAGPGRGQTEQPVRTRRLPPLVALGPVATAALAGMSRRVWPAGCPRWMSLSSRRNRHYLAIPTTRCTSRPLGQEEWSWVRLAPRRSSHHLFLRIVKRRESRKKATGSDVTMYTPRKRKYLHESRHKHAVGRKRGPGGRFLSKEERESLAKAGGLAAENDSDDSHHEEQTPPPSDDAKGEGAAGAAALH